MVFLEWEYSRRQASVQKMKRNINPILSNNVPIPVIARFSSPKMKLIIIAPTCPISPINSEENPKSTRNAAGRFSESRELLFFNITTTMKRI